MSQSFTLLVETCFSELSESSSEDPFDDEESDDDKGRHSDVLAIRASTST